MQSYAVNHRMYDAPTSHAEQVLPEEVSAEIVDIRIKRLPLLTAHQAFAGRSGICDLSSDGHCFYVEFSRDHLDVLITVIHIGKHHPLQASSVQRGDSVSLNYLFAIDEDAHCYGKAARAALKKRSSLLVYIVGKMRKRGAPVTLAITERYHSMEVV